MLPGFLEGPLVTFELAQMHPFTDPGEDSRPLRSEDRIFGSLYRTPPGRGLQAGGRPQRGHGLREVCEDGEGLGHQTPDARTEWLGRVSHSAGSSKRTFLNANVFPQETEEGNEI